MSSGDVKGEIYSVAESLESANTGSLRQAAEHADWVKASVSPSGSAQASVDRLQAWTAELRRQQNDHNAMRYETASAYEAAAIRLLGIAGVREGEETTGYSSQLRAEAAALDTGAEALRQPGNIKQHDEALKKIRDGLNLIVGGMAVFAESSDAELMHDPANYGLNEQAVQHLREIADEL